MLGMLCLTMNGFTADSFPLWPHKAPGALGDTDKDIPTLTVFKPEEGKATGAAMVICPGGGYGGLAQHEGKDYAEWLAKNGVTEDELNRARLPLLTSMNQSVRSNAYWLNAVIDKAQEKPQVLDWARTRIADTESITKEELSELAKKYLGRDRVSRATILPGANEPKIPMARPDGQ